MKKRRSPRPFLRSFCGLLLFLFINACLLFTPVTAGLPEHPPPQASGPTTLPDPSPPPSLADPFADLLGPPTPVATGSPEQASTFSRPYSPRHTRTFFKQELHGQITFQEGQREPYRRVSYGGEVLQRFSDRLKTWGSFNAQLRFVSRAGFIETQNDMEGESRTGGFLEYHNLYFDHFNILDSFLSPEARAQHIGRFNLRLGRFYVPMGLNVQTDTHGTLLQLSNDRNFGFERDWYAGLWGALTDRLNYDLYAMTGSGYDLRLEGQKGLIGLRVSLNNRFLFDHGWEGGLGVITGERLSTHALMRSPSVAAWADEGRFIETRRIGLDARHTRPIAFGSLTMTGEWTSGRDESDDITTQLYQIDALRRDRRLGYSLQYRRFRQEIGSVKAHGGMHGAVPGPIDASLIGEITWYVRNDIDNAFLHWVKLNIERQTERQTGSRGTLATLQYYHYW
jgi:hypothetical protein